MKMQTTIFDENSDLGATLSTAARGMSARRTDAGKSQARAHHQNGSLGHHQNGSLG